jgi:vancomycin permeability regulator SanA
MEPSGLELGLLRTATQEDFMRTKLLIAAAGLVAFVTPALAADYYIVQDTSTKRCSIVEQRPTTQTTTVVGDKAYTTRTEAEGAMKTVKVCESGGTVGGPVPPPPPGR